MLIQYSVKNFRSFQNENVLSMRASQQKTFSERLLSADGLRVVPSAMILGPNASGKSNFVESLALLQEIVLKGSLRNIAPKYKCYLHLYPFTASEENINENKVIKFSIEFIQKDGKHFRYTLAFDAEQQVVVQEALDIIEQKKAFNIYHRHRCKTTLNNTDQKVLKILDMNKETISLVEDRINDNLKANELFLVHGFKNVVCREIAEQVEEFFAAELHAIKDFSLKTQLIQINVPKKTAARLVAEFNRLVGDITKMAGMDRQKIFLKPEYDIADPDKTKAEYISTLDTKNRIDTYPSFLVESRGTMKLIDAVWTSVETLISGGTFVADGFDTFLHPELMKSILILFNDPKINKNHAQLIFTTHNPILLNNKIFRKDQIFFIENEKETHSSSLYSMTDFGSDVRSDEDYLLNYFKGKYGALPFADFSGIITKF